MMNIAWHGNKPVGIDFETTGLQSGYHEIIQIGIPALTSDLRPDPDHAPFYEHIRPEYPERQSKEVAEIHGIDMEWLMDTAEPASVVAEWLTEWFRSLELPEGKRLVPIAHNWAFESAHLDAWLGAAHKETIFHYHARDTMSVCGYLKDRNVAHLADNDASLSLSPLCKYFGIENDRPHDALSDAYACAELYRQLTA